MIRANQAILHQCAFKTQRLVAMEWHTAAEQASTFRDLAEVVVTLLTKPVTQSLPEAWHGEYSIERANSWIEERDDEGTTLLVLDRIENNPIGLIFLFQTNGPQGSAGTEVRIGYLLTDQVWGRGLGTELIEGLVVWCRDQPNIHSLVGGVDQGNTASQRVLDKCGFLISERHDGRSFYQIVFGR